MFRHTRYIRRLVLGRFLLVTNTVSACVLDSLGDALEQRGVEHVRPHDWPRTLRMGTVGLLLAPVDHYWYRFLDSRFPGTRAAVITKKITLDILILAPLSVVLFYILMCKLEGKRWKEAVAETKQKFATTYELDLILWPVIQAINFRYVPPSLRVLFQNATDVVWTMLLSYLKHHEMTETHIWDYWK